MKRYLLLISMLAAFVAESAAREVYRPRAKIRISEGRSKHRLDYAEREYLRRQPKMR